MNPPQFSSQFDPKTGQLVEIASGIARVTAPNASTYTFTGTNSYLVGTSELIVIDPGPDDPHHLDALLGAIAERPVRAIVLTHTHRDHSALAPKLASSLGRVPLWFEGPHRLSRPLRAFERNRLANAGDWGLTPDRQLHDGELISVDAMSLRIVATPGHCANHIVLGVDGQPYIFTGDHVMGWNSTLVSPPDGSMADYLRSMDRMLTLPQSHYLPAHGPDVPDGQRLARSLLAHRHQRNAQILQILSDGPARLGDIVRQMYPGVDGKILSAATMTVRAHLEFLAQSGRVSFPRWPGARVRLSRSSKAS